MFAHKGKYPETRLDSGPATTPQGVDVQLVNGKSTIATHPTDMDPDSSVICDTHVSSNTNTSDKTLLLEEIQSSSANNKSIDSSVSFEVPSTSQNFSLNVGHSVGNIATIQNVVPSGGNPTLWLPTIITSSTSTTNNDHLLESQVEGSSNNLSQIILSGNGTHPNSVSLQSGNKYSPKVQILTIPKHGALQQAVPISSVKTVVHTTYINQNDAKAKSPAPIVNSVLTNKSLASIPFASGAPQINPHSKPAASVACSGLQMVNMPSTTNKTSNTKNGSSVTAQHQSHVLSRVVPGPKLSTQAVGRNLKNSNTLQYQKVTGKPPSTHSVYQAQSPSPMSVKIIQHQNVPTGSKNSLKSMPPSRSGILTAKQRASTSNSSYNQLSNHKQGNYSKSVSGMSSKPGSRHMPHRLVVQQTPNRMMMSNSVGSQGSLNRTVMHYQQCSSESIENTNTRYNPHHDYSTVETSTPANSSSNQSLTAQILQSLSQPKMTSSRLAVQSSLSPTRYSAWEDTEPGTFNNFKQIQGDPNTIRNQDDSVGIEERPNLPDDSLSFHYYSLHLVKLDHTYAVTPQSIAGNSSNISAPAVTNTAISSTSHSSNTSSPTKPLPSPTKCQSPLPVSHLSNSGSIDTFSYGNLTSRRIEERDDDTASVLSSIDGEERKDEERNGSDTETAPEGEEGREEEGKTRCVCEFTHDDGYMICCDRCSEWQHVDCMAIDRQNIPDDYMCERCQPRLIDRKRARSIQMRKKEELTGLYSSASDSSSGASGALKKAPGGRVLGHQKKLLTVTTYSNTIGGVSRTVPMVPPQQTSSFTSFTGSSVPSIVNKRGPKRTRRVDSSRKGPKRKLPEKKMRRKSEVSKYKSKYSINSSQQASQWSDSYELAMTNHYSPELRAKIARYSSNKIGTNHNVASSVLTAHFCTTVPHAGSKILIATKDMRENCPIIELRGKYMLSAQHKPQPQLAGRAGSQRPGPYLFFYKLPKDTTQVCIDTRTYGNEARFVRRSCKPNAELQHCIVKGALHVYLVTVSPIQSNTEITIRHESSGSYQPCACGNPKYCEQSVCSPSNANTEMVHRNNGASVGSCRERRGRTRHISSSNTNLTSVVNVAPSNRKETSNIKVDKRRKSEPDTIVHSETKLEDDPHKALPVKIETSVESDLEAIKGELKDQIKCDDESISKNVLPVVKEEKVEELIEDVMSVDVKKDEMVLDVKQEVPEESTELDSSKLPSQPSTPTHDNASQKQKDNKINKTVGTRRTSTHSIRTTRASLSLSNATESADEKSDSQSESKVSAKEKKKMTREERKMEAIVKAIERMEKAEQRKLENKDKQTKRRESDPQQCSVTSSSDSKDVQNDATEDNQQRATVKGRPRRRGRLRTTSQTKNTSRMNSIDSDNIGTSEDEHHPSLMSPPRKCGFLSENYLDTPPVSSTESPYQTLAQTDCAIKQTIDRINYDLSSVCLLVEAAVAPLETTFKCPKTKKDRMNEWLNKSPEPNMSYDIGSPDYNSADNNNTRDHYAEKSSYLGAKSTENLVKAASTMIGNLSGGIITADSTPEKNNMSDPSDNENSSLSKNTTDCYSPLAYQPRNLKRVARDLTRDTSEKNRTPKKMRRGMRNLDPSPLKRSLRSSGGNRDVDCDIGVRAVEEKRIGHPEVEHSNPVTTCLPPPPQHSAKKRWLRQAISEESDSPTAESPPSEMLTPLKKRRLARESLTSEPSHFVQNDDAPYLQLANSPAKESLFSDPNQLVNDENNCKENFQDKLTDDGISDTPVVGCNADTNKETLKCHLVNDNCGSFQQGEELNAISDDNHQHDDSISKCNETQLENKELIQLDRLELLVENKSDESACNSVKSIPNAEPRSEPASNAQSTETSCNSSPILDEMDDIQKKIHSFHTENIQILKIRNKKQPKEKRKKVNLNFDLSVLDNQTVEVKLKSEKETVDKSGITNVVELNSTETVDNTTVEGDQSEGRPGAERQVEIKENSQGLTTTRDKQAVSDVRLNNNFPSSVLFSDVFHNKPSVLEPESSSEEPLTPLPDMNIIKNVIDMTVNYKTTFKDSLDEYKNVEEILSRVNQMDSSNSVLLSGLMKDASMTSVEEIIPPKTPQFTRSNDPRLNPPSSDKPKPVRRKLSITEYRRRHSMAHPSESSSSPPAVAEPSPQPQLSEDEEDMIQFEKKLEASLTKLDNIMSNMNMGIFNPQPTVEGKQREKLSERLRREFGLTISEEEMACNPLPPDIKSSNAAIERAQKEDRISSGSTISSLALDPPPLVALSSQLESDG